MKLVKINSLTSCKYGFIFVTLWRQKKDGMKKLRNENLSSMAGGVAMVALAVLSVCFSSCSNNANANEDEGVKTESVELMKTSQSWDGAELPDYLVGKPELRALKVTLAPHSSLAKHHHDIMSFGVVNKGELTIVRESDGKEVTVREGETVVETVGTVHHGENRGEEPVELVVFYLSQDGMPLSVADE